LVCHSLWLFKLPSCDGYLENFIDPWVERRHYTVYGGLLTEVLDKLKALLALTPEQCQRVLDMTMAPVFLIEAKCEDFGLAILNAVRLFPFAEACY